LAGILGGIINSPDPIAFIVSQIKAALQQAVDQAVDIAKRAFKEVEGIFKSTEGFIKQNLGQNATRRMFGMMNKKFEMLRLFMSDANAEMYKKKLNEFMKIAEEQFEDLNLPLIIAILKYRSCKFSSLLKAFFKTQVDQFKGIANRAKTEFFKLANLSGLKTNLAVDMGSIRVPSKRRSDISGSYADRVNREANRGLGGPSGGGTGTGYVPSSRVYVKKDITAAELEWVRKIDVNGDPDGRFEFAPQVKGMGDKATRQYNSNPSRYPNFNAAQNYQDAGWAEVKKHNPQVYILLARVLDKMKLAGHLKGKPMVINSAYRSPTYNSNIPGAATRSLHMSAAALDCTQVLFNNAGIKDFIRFASEEHFGGIAYYSGSNFTHIDIGPVRTWNTPRDRSIATTLAKHAAGDYRNGSNNVKTVEQLPINNPLTGDLSLPLAPEVKQPETKNPGNITPPGTLA